MQAFAFIESNTTGTGRIAIERLSARGDRIVFFTRTPEKYPFLDLPGVETHEANTNDAAGIVETVRRVHARTPLTAVLSFSTFYVPTAARAAKELGLPGLASDTAALCHDKFACRTALAQAGLSTPGHWRVRPDDDLAKLEKGMRFPCIVKPIAESSSTGVRLVRDASELREHIARLSARSENERGQALDGSVLVEEYLDGPEYSVETFHVPDAPPRVLGVTDKHLTPPPRFVELGHDFPSAQPRVVQQRLIDATLAALEAVGFNWGPAHTELRMTSRGPVVIEINPRLAGGMIPILIERATGIDPLDAILRLAAGQRVDLHASRAQRASLRFVVAETSGTLMSISGEENARVRPGITEVHVARKPGVQVKPPESALDRLGYVLAEGDDLEQMKAALDGALSDLSLEISK